MANATRVNGEKYRNAPPRVVQRVLDRRQITPEGCWMWPGPTAKGYGYTVYKVSGEQFMVYVHRLVYVHLVTDPGDTMQLDHRCHDPETCTVPPKKCPHRRCFNPADLEPATNIENSMRGRTLIATNTAKTHCGTCGEPYDEANTYWHNGQRACRNCARIREAARRELHGDRINAGRRAVKVAAKLACPRYCCVCGADMSLYHGRARYCEACTPTRHPERTAQHAQMERGKE